MTGLFNLANCHQTFNLALIKMKPHDIHTSLDSYNQDKSGLTADTFADAAASLAFVLCLFSIVLGSCKQRESAASYNDRVIVEIHRASERITDFYTGSDKHDGQLDALESYMAGAKDRLEGIGYFHDDQSLLNGATELIEFYGGLCSEENRELLDLVSGNYYTQDDSVAVQALLTGIIKEDNRHNQEFTEIQASFARRHGVILVRRES